MITYKRCTEVNEADIYKAFQIGFSDYIIKLEMTKINLWVIFLVQKEIV